MRSLRVLWVIELIIVLESVLYSLIKLRTAIYTKGGILTLDFFILLKNYREEGLIYEIIGIIPLNLIIGTNYTTP